MLVWSRSGKLAVWSFAGLLVGIVFLAPLAVILAASFAGQWNGVLPSAFTFEHFAQSAGGASGEAVFASLATGVVASLLALISGAWAALALRSQRGETPHRQLARARPDEHVRPPAVAPRADRAQTSRATARR